MISLPSASLANSKIAPAQPRLTLSESSLFTLAPLIGRRSAFTIGVSSESNAKSFFLDSESQHKFCMVAAIRSLLISHVDANIGVTRLTMDPFRSRITFLPMGCLETLHKTLAACAYVS